MFWFQDDLCPSYTVQHRECSDFFFKNLTLDFYLNKISLRFFSKMFKSVRTGEMRSCLIWMNDGAVNSHMLTL